MITFKKILFALPLSIFALVLSAQPTTDIKYETMLEVAETAADSSDYYNAIEWFEKAYKESRDKDIAVAIADLSMLIRDYKKAERNYTRLLRRDKDGEYDYLRIDLARCLKYMGKYREALDEFNYVVSTTEDEEVKKQAQLELDGLEMMSDYAENIEAVVQFAGKEINTGSAESSPMTYVDGSLYYGSFNRKNEIILDGDEPDYHAKIYAAPRNDKGGYDKPSALGEQINRVGFNNSGVSFSPDGKRMYFTRSRLQGTIVDYSKIYVAYKNDKGWGSAMELENVNGDYMAMHPYEGDLYGEPVLYFSSNMDGGSGGFDLYYCPIKGDEYGIPVNLGEGPNTAMDEITPYYQEGTLYWSTDGRPGMGGLDIYYASWNGSEFADITNLGKNYNSSVDDFYLRFNKDGNMGFLVSNRPNKNKRKMKGSTTCCDDIYLINLRDIVIDLKVFVNNEEGPLEGATIELVDESIDDALPESKNNFSSNDFNFLLDSDHSYKAVITREGYYPDSITFNTIGILDDYTVKKTVTLKPKPVEIVPETEIVTINQPIRLGNIYYDLDKWDILPESEDDLSYLQSLMLEYDDMVIELSSHTDSRGKSRYNQTLSQKRAESARNWLIERGISEDRIVPVGYGEEKILNRCVNGVRCPDEEHRLNRRTEFKIIAGPETIEIKKEIQKVPDEKKK